MSPAPAAPPEREWTIGRSRFRFEPPDVLWAKFQGMSSREEAIQLVDLLHALGTNGPFYVLLDMELSQGMESEARRYISENTRPEVFLGVIYFNTRLLHRAIAKGLLLAMELTRTDPNPLREKIYFVSTQANAYALLAQLRAKNDADTQASLD